MIFSYSGPDLLTDELLFLKKFMPLFGHSLNELANEKKIVTFNVVIETVEVKKNMYYPPCIIKIWYVSSLNPIVCCVFIVVIGIWVKELVFV